MRALVVRDDVQLRRIESAITRFETRPERERRRMASLLAALQNERAELLRYGHLRRKAAVN